MLARALLCAASINTPQLRDLLCLLGSCISDLPTDALTKLSALKVCEYTDISLTTRSKSARCPWQRIQMVVLLSIFSLRSSLVSRLAVFLLRPGVFATWMAESYDTTGRKTGLRLSLGDKAKINRAWPVPSFVRQNSHNHTFGHLFVHACAIEALFLYLSVLASYLGLVADGDKGCKSEVQE